MVLDEVDHLLRTSGDEVLYQLLRIDEDREKWDPLTHHDRARNRSLISSNQRCSPGSAMTTI